ncbi:MAG TPA: arylamine N-acetyltransferase, partial [Vicinamibacteria bacterium]
MADPASDIPRDTSLDLHAYLRRIGVAAPPPPTLDGLRALHEAHCASIVFENLDLHLGKPIRVDLASVQAKLVAGGRGGYCYEQNTLLAAVLEALGFRILRLAARVRVNTTEVRPRTHMLLRVDLPGGPFLADTGFGGDGTILPVPIEPAGEVRLGATAHRVAREDDLFVLQVSHDGSPWTDLYAFNFEPQIPADYEMANHFTSTFPRSPFLLNLTAQRARRSRRAILRNRDLTIREAGQVTSSSVRDPDHLLDILATEFGLAFPPGTRFAKP